MTSGGEAFKIALSGCSLRRSVFIMLVVGNILNIINQGEIVIHGGKVEWVKGLLTFIVPFCVSTFSVWGSLLESRKNTCG